MKGSALQKCDAHDEYQMLQDPKSDAMLLGVGPSRLQIRDLCT